MLSHIVQKMIILEVGLQRIAGSAGVVPPSAPSGDVDIYGYINSGSLSFTGTKNHVLTVHDTLVIDGNLTIGNKSINLTLPAGGVLIVLGNFTATNKITVANGGIFVVTGDMDFSSSPQDDFQDNGGELFVNGSVSGNASADAVDQDFSALQSTYPDIYNFVYTGDFVSSGGVTPLPIVLKTFKAQLANNAVVIKWVTASELNNDFFTIERSRDGKNYEAIGTVQGKGTTNVEQQYEFTDREPLLGYSYYRLQQTDLDGATEIFDVVSVRFDGFPSDMKVYPNPANGGNFSLSCTGLAPGQNVHIQINDLSGKVVYQKDFNTEGYSYFQKEVQLGNYVPQGVYTLMFRSAARKEYTKLVIN